MSTNRAKPRKRRSQRVAESDILLENLEQPLVALAGYIKRVQGSDYILTELVREADAEWGQSTGERPHFERPGQPPDADDPYTTESVRAALTRLAEGLSTA